MCMPVFLAIFEHIAGKLSSVDGSATVASNIAGNSLYMDAAIQVPNSSIYLKSRCNTFKVNVKIVIYLGHLYRTQKYLALGLQIIAVFREPYAHNMPYFWQNLSSFQIYIKGLEAKGPFLCLGLQVSIKRAYQIPVSYSFL